MAKKQAPEPKHQVKFQDATFFLVDLDHSGHVEDGAQGSLVERVRVPHNAEHAEGDIVQFGDDAERYKVTKITRHKDGYDSLYVDKIHG